MNSLSDFENLKLQNFPIFPITVAITGASGSIYGFRLLQFLLENNYKVELVISKSASKVAFEELDLPQAFDAENPHRLKEQVLSYLSSLPGSEKSKNSRNSRNKKINSEILNTWAYDDVSASISSGSYRTSGMIVIPASMGTIGAISCGTSDNLITRAADVCLKERRKLLLVPREMPLSSIHLENLLKLSTSGAIIAPACPGFYHRPKDLIESVDFVVGKVLDLFGIEHYLFKRWKLEQSVVV